MKRILILFGVVIFFAACNSNQNDKKKFDTISLSDLSNKKANPAENEVATEQISPLQDSLQQLGIQVLQSLKNKDYITFSQFFHPNEGVRFSPYGFIDVNNSKKLLPKDFLESIEKNWTLTWGNFDGSGEKIQLKVIPYLEKFVFNANYLTAEKSSFDEIIGKGNSLNNIDKVYPNLHFIEYHFSGFDKKYNGMDWTSLRLVFKKHQNQYFLISIIHDQWTA
jgi:hypothetical protein